MTSTPNQGSSTSKSKVNLMLYFYISRTYSKALFIGEDQGKETISESEKGQTEEESSTNKPKYLAHKT